jgi:hypothetical protein
MQGAQKLRSEQGVLPGYAATTKVKRNAADGLFTKPSNFNHKRLKYPRSFYLPRGMVFWDLSLQRFLLLWYKKFDPSDITPSPRIKFLGREEMNFAQERKCLGGPK